MSSNYGSLQSSPAQEHDGEQGSLLTSSTAAAAAGDGRFAGKKSAAAALVVIGVVCVGFAFYGYAGERSNQGNLFLGRRRPVNQRHHHATHHHTHPAPPPPPPPTSSSSTSSPPPPKISTSSPCDDDPKSLNSCAAFYTKQSALSVKESTCPAGTKEEVLPPLWWWKCQNQNPGVDCPDGCGTCKPPDKQAGGGCYCAGNSGLCTAACSYPGKDDSKKCKKVPCREEDPEAAGCVPLGDNCGGDAKTNCMNSQGKITTGSCGFSSSPLNPGQNCFAFCSQIPGTKKCQTTRMTSYVTPSTAVNPCPGNSFTAVTSEGLSNQCGNVRGIVLLDGGFSRCMSPSSCPYDSAKFSRECSYADGSNVQMDQNLKDKVTVPNKKCPSTRNRGSEGFPSFFTDPRVPPDADVTCQNACACNTKRGFGPPNCFQDGEPYPGPTTCCYCDGKNVAYDKNRFDSCGYYLPIYGEGVLPDQYSCYNDYATTNGLENSFPKAKTYECVKIGD